MPHGQVAVHVNPVVPHRGQSTGNEEVECLVIVMGEEFIKGRKREYP